MVRFLLAAAAARLIFRLAAARCFSLAIFSTFDLMPLKVLHGAFVRFGLLQRRKCSQIPPLPGFSVLLARVQPVLA
jgi:hypothetical protein